MTTAPVIETAAQNFSSTVTAPTGVVKGDIVTVMVVWADTSLTAGNVSIPGFSSRGSEDIDRTATGYYLHTELFDSNGTDMSGVGSWTVTHSGATLLALGNACCRISGTQGWDAVAGTAFSHNGGAGDGGDVALPEITTEGSDELVVVFASVTGSSTPTGYTLFADLTPVTFLYYKTLVDPAATGTPTTTPSGAGDYTVSIISYKPVVPARRPIIPPGAVHRASRW